VLWLCLIVAAAFHQLVVARFVMGAYVLLVFAGIAIKVRASRRTRRAAAPGAESARL
jgi:hypothetical protein